MPLQGAVEMPLLPKRPPGKKEGKTITIAESVWVEVDRIAQETNHSRNEVVEAFLWWAVEEHRREEEDAPSIASLKRETARLEKVADDLKGKAKK